MGLEIFFIKIIYGTSSRQHCLLNNLISIYDKALGDRVLILTRLVIGYWSSKKH